MEDATGNIDRTTVAIFLKVVLGSSMFALFVCLVLGGLSSSGVPSMMGTHIIFVIATFSAIVGVVTSEIIFHQSRSVVVLSGILTLLIVGGTLFALDRYLQKQREQLDALLTPPNPPPPHAPAIAKNMAPQIRIQQKSTGAGSPNQTMISSPGGMQAGGDITIASDKRVIQSIVLRVYVETDTPPSKVTGPSDADTSAGLQSAVALFTASKERIRFVTDYQFKDRQVSETRRRLSFTYTPETPEQILGKEISFLSSISLLAVNYKDFAGFRFSTNTFFHADVSVNGVPVAQIDAYERQPGALASGQANIDVATAFNNVPAIYSKAVAR